MAEAYGTVRENGVLLCTVKTSYCFSSVLYDQIEQSSQKELSMCSTDEEQESFIADRDTVTTRAADSHRFHQRTCTFFRSVRRDHEAGFPCIMYFSVS